MPANVTIDDASPSIVYLPDGAWNTRSISTPCPSCTANLNYAMMFDDTFHDGTFNSVPGSVNFPNVPLTASMLFNGTAVYIFCALADSSIKPDGDSDMTFFIDGVIRGTFAQSALGTPNVYQYSVPVFSITLLSPGQHTLTIQNGHVNGIKALTLLDKIIYTAVESTSSTSAEDSAKSTKKDPGIIIGPIVAAFLIVLGLGFFFWWRWRKPQSINPQRTTIDRDAHSSTRNTLMSEPCSIPSHTACPSASYPIYTKARYQTLV
ncbi:hypothetical protein BDP27DRAFT_1319970 [Rhodocollybia butyracea]|uniref:Uncharacterized protein n=1 Tax=Rhodocollybia butyracea TaxID=206335 RepID=A0A9P5PUQ1_9AGAR|nr:hypothetical protein BDP27DRAFT_1319970 [Rhodocollybia butyracea]